MNKQQFTIFSLTCPIFVIILITILRLYENGAPAIYIIIMATIGIVTIFLNYIAFVLSKTPEGVYKAITMIKTMFFLYAIVGFILIIIDLIKR